MTIKKFIDEKLDLIKKDDQSIFTDIVDPLSKKLKGSPESSVFDIQADGNWFKISFTALEVKKDRLVINAERIRNGFFGEQYIVEFEGTRAAYLRGYYESTHRSGKWPYIHWDIRSYANHPNDKNKRVYVRGFYAHDELQKMIQRMEHRFGVKNIVNTYINDNLLRLQAGASMKKTPSQIEREWSKGMMEKLGYKYVEAIDTSPRKGAWQGAKVHWYKLAQDSLL